MAEIRWTPQAFEDLEAICLFISRDSPQMAATFADRVLRGSDRLAAFPRMGRIVPEMGVENIREMFIGSYRVIYRIHEEQVQLLTIHHGAWILDVTILDC